MATSRSTVGATKTVLVMCHNFYVQVEDCSIETPSVLHKRRFAGSPPDPWFVQGSVSLNVRFGSSSKVVGRSAAQTHVRTHVESHTSPATALFDKGSAVFATFSSNKRLFDMYLNWH